MLRILSYGIIHSVKLIRSIALLALTLAAVRGEAASSTWEDDALDFSSISTPLLTGTTPEVPPCEHGVTIVIVGPDPDIPSLPPLDGPTVELEQPGALIPEPTSGLLLLVGTSLLILRRRRA